MCCLTLLIACATAAAAPAQEASAGKMWVYIGTYADTKGRGIALLEFDPSTGALASRGLAAELINPSFLAINPARTFLYAVNEVEELGGKKGGAITAFALNRKTGELTQLNQQSSMGAGPCHVTVDRDGKNVLVANYSGGSVAVLPIQEGGRLGVSTSLMRHVGSGPNRARQERPHAHSINLDRANRYAVAADLGIDHLIVYKFDGAKGVLAPNDPPWTAVAPGAGPRHFAFHPDGRHAYVINEIHCTVTAFDYDPDKGVLKEIQTITTLPEPVKRGYSTAEVQVHPSGKFLYGSNRGHNSVAIFTIDPSSGRLAAAGHQSTQGKTPRNFGIDPTGSYLLAANQDSGTVVVFRIDQQTGQLTPAGGSVEVPSPVCVKFVPKSD